jgi:hypothetical protein
VVTRALDLAVLLLLAVAILMPRPDVKVKPALALEQTDRDRVAELQAQLLARPDDSATALELADLFMGAHRPDWALAAVSPALEGHPNDHRLHLRRSLALAEHYEARPAYTSMARALSLCESGSEAKCTDGEYSRLSFLEGTLRRVKDIDMRKNPNAAKEELLKALRPAYLPRKRTPRAKAPAASDAGQTR